MLGHTDAPQYRYKLPILAALTSESIPLFPYQIAELSEVPEKPIAAILQEWAPFLGDAQAFYGDSLQKRYTFFDACFRDYVITTHKETIVAPKIARSKALRSEDLLASLKIEWETSHGDPV
jgi:hypothetical protein